MTAAVRPSAGIAVSGSTGATCATLACDPSTASAAVPLVNARAVSTDECMQLPSGLMPRCGLIALSTGARCSTRGPRTRFSRVIMVWHRGHAPPEVAFGNHRRDSNCFMQE
jgi:hypothetical protein